MNPRNGHSDSPADGDSDLSRLITALLDGSISSPDHARLADLLRSNPAARAAYLDAIDLHALLRWRHTADAARPASAARPLDPPNRDHRILPHRHAPLQRGMVYAFSGVAAALLLAACAVTIYLFASNPKPETRNPKPASPVATLIETTGNLLVNDDMANPGDSIDAGDLSLDAGSADFRLTNGVEIALRGQTQLTVHSPMASTLTRGSAAFDCPPRAKGYTVHLPDGLRIVDLGTRFTVRWDPDGVGRVRVTEGLVRIEHADSFSPPIEVSSGRVCLINRSPDRGAPVLTVALAAAHDKLAAYAFDSGSPVSSVIDPVEGIEVSPFEAAGRHREGDAGVSVPGENAYVRASVTADHDARTLSEGAYLRFVVKARQGYRLAPSGLSVRLGGTHTQAEPWRQTLLIQTSIGGFGPDAPVVARIEREVTHGFHPQGAISDSDDKPHKVDLIAAAPSPLEAIEVRFYFIDSIDYHEPIHRIDDVALIGHVIPDTPDGEKPGDVTIPKSR